MPPGLRMLLITVDGQRTRAELEAMAATLGLPADQLESCFRRGWLRCGPPADHRSVRSFQISGNSTVSSILRR
jgi:hypothetical protein